MLDALFSIILPIHITTVLVLVVLVIIADKIGFAWIRGKKEVLDRKILGRLHLAIHAGLSVAILTGALLFYPYKSYLLTLSVFWIKMFFVFALIANSFVIGKLMKVATSQGFASLKKAEKRKIIISGAISTMGWVGAIVAAQFLGL